MADPKVTFAGETHTIVQKPLPASCYSKNKRTSSQIFCFMPHHAVSTTLQGCYNALKRGVSTHFAIKDDVIWQMVPLNRASWSSGVAKYNTGSIAVEMINSSLSAAKGYPVSDKTLRTTAWLCAYYIVKYKLGAAKWKKNVWFHRDVNSTACPGAYTYGKKAAFIKLVQSFIDKDKALKKATTAPAASSPSPASKPVVATTKTYTVTVKANGTNVRSAPKVAAGNVVATVSKGKVYTKATRVTGAKVGSSTVWYKVASGKYLHSSVVTAK